jgi:hypothetical protein
MTTSPEHLAFIQNVISRLADQSRSLKGWAVTLVAALLAFAAQQSSAALCAVALYTIVTLSGLDAYYLALERNYRKLYENLLTVPAPSWSLDAGPLRAAAWLRSWLRPSIVIFYGVSAVICIVAWTAAWAGGSPRRGRRAPLPRSPSRLTIACGTTEWHGEDAVGAW